MKTRDSCQPEHALEPSSSSSSSSPHTPGSFFDANTTDNFADEIELFVPERSAKKGKSAKDKLDTTQEVLKVVQEALRNDPTKEMISFLRDEMEKSCEHELKLFQLLLDNRGNSGLPPSSMEPGFYPSWNQGLTYPETGFYPAMQGSFRAQQTTQERMTEGSYDNPFLTVMENTGHCKVHRAEIVFIYVVV